MHKNCKYYLVKFRPCYIVLCKHNRKDNVKIYEYMFSISRSKNVGNIPKIESLFTFYIAV